MSYSAYWRVRDTNSHNPCPLIQKGTQDASKKLSAAGRTEYRKGLISMGNLSAWPAFHFLQEALQTTSAHRQLGWGLGVKPSETLPRQKDRVGCSQGEAILGTAWNKSKVQGYNQP